MHSGGDHFDALEHEALKKLRAIQPLDNTEEADDRGFKICTDIAEVATALERSPQARLVAGSTDYSLEITQGLADA